MRSGHAFRPEKATGFVQALRVARAVLPWVLASLAALLLTRELSPPSRGSAIVPPPPSTAPQKEEKEEIVYEPWEQVST